MMEDYNKDTLFLALTRPATLFGIPMEAFVLITLVSGLAMILADSIFYLLISIPLFLFARVIVFKDPNAFTVLFKYFETSARCINSSFWGGASCSPLRLRRRYNMKDVD